MDEDWIKVFERLEQMKAYNVMSPDRIAITNLARALRYDVRFRTQRPVLSHMTLCLYHDFGERHVVAWFHRGASRWTTEKMSQYEIGYRDSNLDLSEVTYVGNELVIVADKLAEYVAKLPS